MSKFNLSEELKELFSIAKFITSNNNGFEVTIDCVVAGIFNRYFLSNFENERKDELLKEFFSEFDKEDKDSIIEDINLIMAKQFSASKNIFLGNLRSVEDDNSVILSSSLDFLMRKLEARHEHKPISTFDFLIGAGMELKSSEIMTSVQDYGITYESLSNFQMGKLINGVKGLNNNDSGELKEKNISYDDEDRKRDIESEDKEFEMAGNGSDLEQPSGVTDPNSTTPFLDKYSYNMTKAAREGKYDPVIGREVEISQIIEILACRKKKNAILLGDAGAGKTTCVEGLAQMIVNDQVPLELKGKEIRSIDLTSMVSNSIYRGEYESKILGVIHEMEQNPNIIGFIDEIHNLVGSGSSTQNNDGANILKPYLSRGSITLIGSTTEAEYRKFIEKDSALKRRFQTVTINEPDQEQTIEILKGIAPKYEQFHRVKYTPEVIKACVEWSARYINDRYFPDKAIDCLDISGSLTKLDKIIDMSVLENLEKSIKDVTQEKIDLVNKCEFEEAQKRRDLEEVLMNELANEKDKIDTQLNNPESWPEVTVEKVAEVISKISRVPVDKIRQTTFDKLISMKKAMESRVIGQDNAIQRVFMNLSRQFMGIKDSNKPASLLFVGRSATGKTELAKVIADEVFSGEKSLIRVNGGDLIEKGAVTKLIGASASFVGYDDEPLLLQIKRRPFSVFLIDEVEKMSEEILNTIFLPILDEGYTTLANNEKISFKNTIIIMTSNLGVREVSNKNNLGFGKVTKEIDDKDNEDIIMKAIKKKFRPEMLNRISGGVVFFASLGEPELLKIFDLELGKLQKRLGEKGFKITVTEKMKKHVVSKCDLQYGARDLQREMTKYIEEAIIDAMMNNQDGNLGNEIIVDVDDNGKSSVSFNSTIIMDNLQEPVKA